MSRFFVPSYLGPDQNERETEKNAVLQAWPLILFKNSIACKLHSPPSLPVDGQLLVGRPVVPRPSHFFLFPLQPMRYIYPTLLLRKGFGNYIKNPLCLPSPLTREMDFLATRQKGRKLAVPA